MLETEGQIMSTWKEQLADQIPAEMGNLIDSFEAQIELRKQGKLDEKVFAEQRLRKGAYGQRYDTTDSAMTAFAPVT